MPRHPQPALLLLPLLLLAGRCDGPDTGPDSEPPAWEPAQGLSAELYAEIGSLVTARWEQIEACTGTVAFRFEDEAWRQAPERELPPGDAEQLLLGVPYGAEAEIRLEQRCEGREAWSSEPIVIATDPLPEGLPHAALISAEDGAWDPGVQYLVTSLDSREDATDPNACWTVIVDRRGRTVWALPSPQQRVTLSPRVGVDGRSILIDHNSYWGIFDSGEASQVQRVDILGQEIERYDTPGLHHPFTELPDGGIAWGAASGMTELLQVLAPGASEPTTLWSCQGFHQSLGSLLPCSANTLTWSEARGSYLFSFFSTDTVVEIDDEGSTLRWFGALPGAWAFEPSDSQFFWQHGPVFTDEGTLLLSTLNGEPGDETLVREYALDEANETLVQVFAFGAGEGIYGDELGEAWRLPGGNTLHNMGTAQRIREITPEGEVVWDLSWSRGSFVGRSEPVGELWGMLGGD